MWNEFAAATGSTLGVFMLFLSASDPSLDAIQAERIREGYFPSICALHILLDYLIDQAEDVLGGDLNFCSYYADQRMLDDRLTGIVQSARRSSDGLPFSKFHRMIVEGLIAVYLSDPKVKGQHNVKATAKRLMKGSPWTRVFFWLNSHWIRKAL
jgi:tetraprenyl-beta-curcumene synthase